MSGLCLPCKILLKLVLCISPAGLRLLRVVCPASLVPRLFSGLDAVMVKSEVWSHVIHFNTVQSKAEGLFLLASECSQEMNVCHLGEKPGLAVTWSQEKRKRNCSVEGGPEYREEKRQAVSYLLWLSLISLRTNLKLGKVNHQSCCLMLSLGGKENRGTSSLLYSVQVFFQGPCI